jgi:hypothetical protein
MGDPIEKDPSQQVGIVALRLADLLNHVGGKGVHREMNGLGLRGVGKI